MILKKIHICLCPVFITIISFIAVSLNLDAQNIPLLVRNQYFNHQKQNLKDIIDRRTGIEFPFVIGYNYNQVTNSESNHPYFKENKWTKGSLVYQGLHYTAEGLKYDIEIDKLIYLMYNKENTMNGVALDENFIREFSVLNSTFRYYSDLKNDTGRKLKAGYFEVVYDGKLKFLVRSQKSEALNNFSSSTDLFLLKDGKTIGISSMGKLLRQLEDKRKSIKKFVKDNSLKLNKSDYSSASRILKFYENL